MVLDFRALSTLAAHTSSTPLTERETTADTRPGDTVTGTAARCPLSPCRLPADRPACAGVARTRHRILHEHVYTVPRPRRAPRSCTRQATLRPRRPGPAAPRYSTRQLQSTPTGARSTVKPQHGTPPGTGPEPVPVPVSVATVTYSVSRG